LHITGHFVAAKITSSLRNKLNRHSYVTASKSNSFFQQHVSAREKG